MNMSPPDLKRTTPLNRFFRMAIMAGVESAVRIHIERGDDLNARDAGGNTPLMLAASRNKLFICKLLLEAGADPLLKNSGGYDALSIADAADAREAVLLLQSAFALHQQAATSDNTLCSGQPVTDGDVLCVSEHLPTEISPNIRCNAKATGITPPSTPEFCGIAVVARLPAQDFSDESGWRAAPRPLEVELIEFDEGGVALNPSDWEAEAEFTALVGDPTLVTAAVGVQETISGHEPVDVSVGWDDFDAFLPDRASPLPKSNDLEARERLRTLLLRAMREGSVPDTAIVDLTLNDDQTPNVEAGALLRMVINDLGADADERHEYSTHQENFMVHVDPTETPDEEQTVDDALVFIDELESLHNNTLYLYQRDFQQGTLLTAVEEVALGQAMEQGIEAALNALAGTRTGIEAVFNASQLIKSGLKPLRWMTLGKRDDSLIPEADATDSLVAIDDGLSDGDDGENGVHEAGISDAIAPNRELHEFLSNADQLWNIAKSFNPQPADSKTIRDALGTLDLSGLYLLELADSGRITESHPARKFKAAIQKYRLARDRLTIKNLKLVSSIAKKYLFSGVPLDDLLQEGNIGLLKSVDRFDWRRGFKFSTYATWWIRQSVGRYVADKGRTIRIPVHAHEKVQRISQFVRTFNDDKGREPTIDEISELFDLSATKAAAYMQAAMEPMPIHEIDIDSMIASDARDEYIFPDPMDLVSDSDLAAVVNKILGTLKLKDENVLRMRFGIGIPEAMTLDEIGIRMGVTRERIRQIETAAIRHLRHPGRIDVLLTTLNGPNPPKQPKDDEIGMAQEKSDITKEMQIHQQDQTVSIKPLRKNAHKLLSIAVELPSLDLKNDETSTYDTSVSKLVQQLLLKATALGASVKADQHDCKSSIWIDFSKAPNQPPRPLIRKLVDAGFKFWPGKGYWR